MNAFNSQAITAAFAAAAVDPTQWNGAMDVVARETGSFGALLISINGTLPNAPVSESLRPATEVYFRDGWHLRDERYRVLPALSKRGVADDSDWICPDDVRRSAYFQEFLRPFGLEHCGIIKMAAGADLWSVSVQRSLRQGPFSSSQKRELAELSVQFSSAAAVARALGFAAANAAAEAFELSGSAAALVNSRGEVLRLNRAAEALLDADLRIVNKRLASADRAATRALDRALNDLLWVPEPSALARPVLLPRRNRRPVLACPLRPTALAANAFSDCRAILVLLDLDKRGRPPLQVLQAAFGLTPTEARLTAHLASGAALETAADEQGIAKETARNHLKAIFQKTDTHRQSELVALLATLLTPLIGG